MNDTSVNSDTSEFPLHCSSPLKSAPIKEIDNKLRSVCLSIQSIKSKREATWNLLDSSNPDILSADSKMLLEKFGMPQLLYIHDMFDFWSTL
jgi:hypothetical protein